jgi:hypothetical protein
MLAIVGIYGVMSYLVKQRTREIGIRLALGAADGDILRLVVGNGARLIGAGSAIGVIASIALSRLVTMLFGVTAADPASGAAVAMLAAVAVVACYLPAARGTHRSAARAAPGLKARTLSSSSRRASGPARGWARARWWPGATRGEWRRYGARVHRNR